MFIDSMTITVADPEKHFYLHEGGKLSNLEELFTELQTMDNHVFNHHVNKERNDFANWVRDVMGERILARNIMLAKNQDDLCKLLFMSLFK